MRLTGFGDFCIPEAGLLIRRGKDLPVPQKNPLSSISNRTETLSLR
jgi:hypothetical protein